MMKVLANMPQGLSPTQQAQARENINCKPIQAPLELSYADYGFLKKLTQDANGVVNAECSYISAATSDTTGLMSSSDKSKLDGIATGAEVNQNAFSALKVGATTIYADSKTDTLELIAGSNITLTPNANDDSLTISATDTTYTAGTGISISGNTISCTVAGGSQIYTQNNGQAGIVEHQVSKLSLDTDFLQIIADNNQIGVFAPTPQSGDNGKVVTVSGDTLIYDNPPQTGSVIKTASSTSQGPVYNTVDQMTLWPSSGLLTTTVNNITDPQGYLAPYVAAPVTTQKVYGVPAGSTIPQWMSSGAPAPLQLLGWSTIVAGNSAETIYVEDGRAYFVDMTTCPGLLIDTNVIDHPVHTIIEMYATGASGWANCPSWRVHWLDETTMAHDIGYTCSSTETEVHYMLDVTVQKLWSTGDQQYYTVARVFDFPALNRESIPQQYSADNTVLQVGAYLDN